MKKVSITKEMKPPHWVITAGIKTVWISECEWCKKEFILWKKASVHGWNLYCGRQCSSESTALIKKMIKRGGGDESRRIF